MKVNSENIEFGYELISVLPYAYYLHSQNKLTETISGMDTECLYYFSPRHTVNEEQRSWYNTPKVTTPNISIHKNYLDTKEFKIPPYKEIYKNKKFKFKKETVIICNRHNVEWSTKPINFFDLKTLEKLFNLLQDKYQIVYINVEGRKELYDNAPPVHLGDFELLKKYPKVINIHDIKTKLSFNELQLNLFANCEKYITMNGGHSILASYFGGENIVMSKYGKPETKEIHKNINSFYRWYREFGGQRVVHVANETKLIGQVKSQWVSKDPLINILVRTSGRPNYFRSCIESIHAQNYKNLNIWVSVDNGDKYTFSYPVYPITVKPPKIELSIRAKTAVGKFCPYNDYFNQMHKEIKSGLIMYLDDDDKLNNRDALKEIAEEHKKGNDLIFWKANVGGKIVPPAEYWEEEPAIFNISGIGFAFDAKYKKLAEWTPWKRGDFRVANKLYHGITNQGWINKVLAKTQEGSHGGHLIDKIESVQKKEIMEKMIKVRIVNPKRGSKHKFGEIKELKNGVAMQLIRHGIAVDFEEEEKSKAIEIVEEKVKKPAKKTNKIKKPVKKNKSISFK